jgi:hypothetical protein
MEEREYGEWVEVDDEWCKRVELVLWGETDTRAVSRAEGSAEEEVVRSDEGGALKVSSDVLALGRLGLANLIEPPSFLSLRSAMESSTVEALFSSCCLPSIEPVRFGSAGISGCVDDVVTVVGE